VDDETTALLKKPYEFFGLRPHQGPCTHGTFSPRPDSDSVRSGISGDGRPGSGSGEGNQNIFGSFLETVGMKNGSPGKKKMSVTNYLAERHGIKNTTTMYVCKLTPVFLQLC
jgi:hypothetical protein